MIQYCWKGRNGLMLAAAFRRSVHAWALSIAHADESVVRVEYWDTIGDVLSRARALGAEVQS